jgi:hypothetical protein
VDPNLFPIAAGDPYSVYVSDHVLPQPEVSPPSISRDIPLLLRETEWHVHFAAQLADHSLRENTRALFTSAKNPGAGPLLNRAVKDWFAKAYRHIKSQDVIVRRLLSKEGQPPFNPLTVSKSITDYLSYVITFLSLCIRAITHPSHTYLIPLSREQLASLQDLVDSLAAGTQPSHEQVQKALWHLLCSHPPDIHTDKWRSPLRCFLALWALQSYSEDGFPGAARTSPILARLTHLICTTFHEEMYVTRGDYGGMVLR